MLSLSRKGLLSVIVVCVLLSSGLGVYAGYYAGVHGPSPNPNPSQIGDILTLDDIYYTGEIYQGAGGTAITSAITTKEASYIVWGTPPNLPTIYYALSGTTGITTSNANAATLIQACINALPAAGGKIFLKAGRYDIATTLQIPKYVTLEGEQTSIINGSEGTWLILANGANTNLITNKLQDGTEIGITLRNLVLYGNPTNNAAGSGIYFVNSEPSSLFRLDNIVVFGFRDYNIHYWNVNDFWIINSKIVDSYKICLYIEGAHDGWVTGCDVGGAISPNQHAGYIYGSWAIFVTNTAFGDSTGNGLLIEQGGEHTISSSRFGLNDDKGIKLYLTTHNTITGNDIYDNGVHGISIWDSNKTVVSSNNIFDNRIGGSKTQQKAIIEEGTLSDYNNIQNNIVLDNLDPNPILTYGPNTRVGGNVGNTEDSTTLPAHLASDHTASGMKLNGTAGENLVFGNLVYLKSDGKMWKTDANAEATTKGMVCLALGTIGTGTSGTFLQNGLARDDSWAWTVGAPLFISETAGELTSTAPSDPGDFIRLAAVGGPTGDYLYFNGMNLDWGGL